MNALAIILAALVLEFTLEVAGDLFDRKTVTSPAS